MTLMKRALLNLQTRIAYTLFGTLSVAQGDRLTGSLRASTLFLESSCLLLAADPELKLSRYYRRAPTFTPRFFQPSFFNVSPTGRTN